MKKTWFDKALFKDAFRQLSVSGLIILLIMCMQAVLLPIGMVIAARTEVSRYVMTCGITETDPLVFLLFTCATPLMAIGLFRFLSRRNESDFYHSIPQTRGCLFISFAAAVLAWTLILQFIPMILGTIVHLFFPGHFTIDWTSLIMGNIGLFIAELLVLSAVLLAVTITGSILTNLAVSLLIIFFPRILMLAVMYSIGGSLTIVSDSYLSFMGNGWNIVTSLIPGIFEDGTKALYSVRADIYSLLLAVLYFLLALGMFVKRNSEAAGEASINPVLQLVFRLLPATAYCLVPTVLTFSYIVEQPVVTVYEWYMVFILYLIGIVLYFIYELITTRKVRNLAKAVPGLAILAAIQIVILFGMVGLRSSLIAYQPEASEIEAVSFAPEDAYMWDDEGESERLKGALTSKVADVRLTDEHLKELVSVRLKESAEFDKYPRSRTEESQDYFLKAVTIISGGKMHHRNLHLKQSDVAEMAKILKDEPAIRDIYMNMPEADGQNVRITLFNQMVSGGTPMSSEDALAVYNALREDVQNMGFEAWYEFCMNGPGESGNFRLYYREYIDGEWRGSMFPISKKTPAAFAVCMEKTFEGQNKNKDIEDIIGLLKELNERYAKGQTIELTYQNVYFTVYDENGSYVNDYYVDLTNETERKILMDLMERQNGKPSKDGSYIMLIADLEWTADLKVAAESGSAVPDTESLHSFNATVILDENGLDGIDLKIFDFAN